MALPAGISPATWRFEATHSSSLSYGSMKWGRRGDSHSRGADCPAVYETAAACQRLSLLSHAGLRNAECRMRSAELGRAVVTTLVLLIPHSALRTPHSRM